jgi:hypothetical protein
MIIQMGNGKRMLPAPSSARISTANTTLIVDISSNIGVHAMKSLRSIGRCTVASSIMHGITMYAYSTFTLLGRDQYLMRNLISIIVKIAFKSTKFFLIDDPDLTF